jgi:methylated-DNA-[protein]-cysteine S-methyltransferase
MGKDGTMRVETPIGPLVVTATEVGLVGVSFGGVSGKDVGKNGPPSVLAEVRRQLDDYFAGRRRSFDLPLDWSRTSGFQRTVLQELHAEIGFGRTVTYGELAARVGHPEASRAVGIAMASNPLPVVVPCHRVVASGGKLGGFGGGLETKRWLLTHEGSLPPTLFPIENVVF